MFKKLLLIILFSISLFSIEITIDTTSNAPKTLKAKKLDEYNEARRRFKAEQQRAKIEFEQKQRRQREKLRQQRILVEKNRFHRDDEKEVVIDTKLHLMWQDNEAAANVKRSWSATFSQTAKEYCQELEFAGYDDWYLPTIKELESIVDISRYKPAIKSVFKHTASSYYWSSSSHVSHSKRAWGVYFNYGNSNYSNKTDEYYVRCVRAGQ